MHLKHIHLDVLENGLFSFPFHLDSISFHFSSLHNYSTRSDSLDLRVVDVPRLLCTTYQLKEQMTKITEQQQQQTTPLLPPNGDLRSFSTKIENDQEQQIIRTRIDELEQELNHLRLQLSLADQTLS